jgi:hypothetical protein
MLPGILRMDAPYTASIEPVRELDNEGFARLI